MLEYMKEILDSLLQLVAAVLPLSPFTGIIESLEEFPYLGVINWFIPVKEMLTVASGWLVAIGVFYAYSVVARWVKLIQ